MISRAMRIVGYSEKKLICTFIYTLRIAFM